jgi:hypothetical protein
MIDKKNFIASNIWGNGIKIKIESKVVKVWVLFDEN